MIANVVNFLILKDLLTIFMSLEAAHICHVSFPIMINTR